MTQINICIDKYSNLTEYLNIHHTLVHMRSSKTDVSSLFSNMNNVELLVMNEKSIEM